MGKQAAIFLAMLILSAACKTKSEIRGERHNQGERAVKVSDITLYDKPLSVIRKYVEEQRWQMLYASGGLTGKDRITYQQVYYTLTADGKLIHERKGDTETHPYEWQMQRDIFTGDSTYVISGVVNWKVNSIDNDTLRLADNYVDGYSYALIRIE